MPMRFVAVSLDCFTTEWIYALPNEAQLAWIRLLIHVKQTGSKGVIRALSPRIAAQQWGISAQAIEHLIGAAKEAGAIIEEEGKWTLVNWANYQLDGAAERMRRYRERQKDADGDDPESDVTLRNGYESDADQDQGQGQGQDSPLYPPKGEEREREYSPKEKWPDYHRPTESECRAYAEHLEMPSEQGSAFFDHMQSVGWVYGKSKHQIKSAKHSLNTWKRRWLAEQQGKKEKRAEGFDL